MITITIPADNVEERTYAVRTMFEDLLGFSSNCYLCQISSNTKDYIIILPNGNNIIVEDHFFCKYTTPLSYITQQSLPTELNFFHTKWGEEIPIIYGEDKYVENEGNVRMGLDIFASVFFMLARWEETLLGREVNGDCDEKLLFAIKHSIEKRPIVNEYEAILRNILLQNDVQVPKRKFEIVMTHDVDGIITPSYGEIARHLKQQILGKRHVNNLTVLSWWQELKYKKYFPKPYSQFTKYTDLCKQFNIQEWFYFKVCAGGEKEATYLYNDKRLIEVIENLRKDRNLNCKIGFHPSQSTFNNIKQWNAETKRIKALLRNTSLIGRNHHLLYNYSMLNWWESLCDGSSDAVVNISNCVFHKTLGFRSGVVTPYFLFDIYQRRQLNIKEYPCQIMDTALRRAKYRSREDAINDINEVISQTRKHSGILLLTWHIYIRTTKLLDEYFAWCQLVLDKAKITL